MSDKDKPSIVSGPSGDPRSMWITRSDVDKEAQWAANKKKIEKPGYSYVRHTTDEYVSGVRNAADGYAWGAMQLNLTDLRSAMGNTDAGFDDTEIQKELAAQAAKIEKNIQDISLLKTGKADKNHTHPDSGSDYDDSWIQPKLDKKSDLTHTHSSYSDLNHTHDTTHNHDKEYQAKGDYAAELHGHIEYETKVDATIAHDTLNQSISDKADSRHKHDGTYAEFLHSHPLEPHGHDDKYQKLGSYAEEIHFHDEYAENTELNALDAKLDDEIKDREEQGNSLQGQIDALEPYDDTEIKDGLKQEIKDREDADKKIKEQALAAVLVAEYDSRYQDSQYQIRLDYRLFGEPTLDGKETVFHDDDSWPVIVDDDMLHFQSLAPSDRPQVMFKGEKLSAKIKYAFFHFNTERQEWKVSKVEYANGVNRVYGYAVTGNLAISEGAKCDAWFLTEEEALSAPDATGDLLDLSGEETAFTSVENFQTKGALAYKDAEFALGLDVVVQYAQFVANPAAVGLNHDIIPSGRIMWVDEFPVGSTMIIKGASATLALEVVQSRKSGSNNRAHGFEVNVLLESGAFVDGETLQIGTGDLFVGRRLLLDDVVVGDSEWEDRISTLESVDYADHTHPTYFLIGDWSDSEFDPHPDLRSYDDAWMELYDFTQKQQNVIDTRQNNRLDALESESGGSNEPLPEWTLAHLDWESVKSGTMSFFDGDAKGTDRLSAARGVIFSAVDANGNRLGRDKDAVTWERDFGGTLNVLYDEEKTILTMARSHGSVTSMIYYIAETDAYSVIWVGDKDAAVTSNITHVVQDQNYKIHCPEIFF